MSGQPFWKSRSLGQMSTSQWESLCDGCGLCCLHKLEDIDTGEVYLTSVACRLLRLDTICCKNYQERRRLVPDCIALTAGTIHSYSWLPTTCAYRLVDEGKPLPAWHHLVCGDPERVHETGKSVKGRAISEDEGAAPEDFLWNMEP